MGNIHVLCSCDCLENTPENTCMCMCICLKMYLLVTVNHGPSCLQQFMAEGEASDANPGHAIYGTDRHSKANKDVYYMAFFPSNKNRPLVQD